MTAMTPMAKDDPLMIAWEVYKATDEAKNSKYWAAHVTVDNPRDSQATISHLHLEGALWAVFAAGYNAAMRKDTEEHSDG